MPARHRQTRTDKRHAPAVHATGMLHPADGEAAEQVDDDRQFEPRQMEDIHENSSIVPKRGLTWSDSRDASPARKSVQRRSSASHQRKVRTNGATTYRKKCPVQIAALKCDSIKPAQVIASCEAIPKRTGAGQGATDRVFDRAVILQEARRPHNWSVRRQACPSRWTSAT